MTALALALDRLEAAVVAHTAAARRAQEAALQAADARARLQEAREALWAAAARTAAPMANVVDEATGRATRLGGPP